MKFRLGQQWLGAAALKSTMLRLYGVVAANEHTACTELFINTLPKSAVDMLQSNLDVGDATAAVGRPFSKVLLTQARRFALRGQLLAQVAPRCANRLRIGHFNPASSVTPAQDHRYGPTRFGGHTVEAA